jgi:hypothetical protein
MEKEMNEAGDSGYEFRGETVAQTMFGGREVVVIMERPKGESDARFAYRLLATNKTSTMQKELTEAAESGFAFRAVSLGSTAFGGQELVVITEKPVRHGPGLASSPPSPTCPIASNGSPRPARC